MDCIDDDNDSEFQMENEEEKEERAKILGFRPQKEVIYNKLLPYSSKIDGESNEALKQIKYHLPKAVLMKELRPSVRHWTRQLTRYIRLYGLKFSKEDHVLFIKLYLELISIPDVEGSLVEQFVIILMKLLKKKELLSRDDLVIEWRPLYELCHRVLLSHNEINFLEYFPSSLENNLKHIVRICTPYFAPSATQEMLDEWRPLLCPFDVTLNRGLVYMEMFLPTMAITEEERNVSWRLWFQEMFTFWESIHNGPVCEMMFLGLFARLALNNIGYIDWAPHCSKILTRLLRTFKLPVGKLNHTAKVSVPLKHDSMARWIVAMMGGPSSGIILKNIGNMFKAIESYYYPSNLGKWTQTLLSFLQTLTFKFIYRIHKERYKKESWEGKTPEAYRLTDEDISTFVKIVKPVTFLALYSKLGTHQASRVLQLLSTIRPELVLPELLEKSYVALETLTEPHQLRGCLSALTSTLRSMMRHSKWYTEGKSHIIPILYRVLPAIDSNDFPKSVVGFHFISTCFSLMPIVDCSGAVSEHPDLPEEVRNVCLATAELPDFVIQYLDKIFSLIESLNQEHSTQSVETGTDSEPKWNLQEAVIISGICSTVAIILIQSSDEIYMRCLDKIFQFVSTRLLDGPSSLASVLHLCAASAKANPEAAVKKFVPYLCREIKEMFEENPHLAEEERTDHQLQWKLIVLNGVLKYSGRYALDYKEEIFEVLRLSLKVKAKLIYQQACKLARDCLSTWTTFYETDLSSVDRTKTGDKSYLPIYDWGKCVAPWHLKMSWHEPTKDELETGFEMIEHFLLPELEELKDFTEDKKDFSKDELIRCLTIIYNITVGASQLFPSTEEKEVEIKGRKNITELTGWNVKTLSYTPQYIEVLEELGEKAYKLRKRIFDTTRNALWHIMATREDDVKSISKIVAIYSECLMFHELYKNEFDKHWSMFASGKRQMQDYLRGYKRHQRLLVVDRVLLQHQLRTLAYNRTRYTEITHNAMVDLLKLSMSHYSVVRVAAQRVFFRGMQLSPHKAEEHYLPFVLENLKKDPVQNHKQIKGALHLLLGHNISEVAEMKHQLEELNIDIPAGGKNSFYLAYLHQWDVIAQSWPALVNAMYSDKPSIVKLYDKLNLKIQATYTTIAINVKVNEASQDAAQRVLRSSSQPAVGTVSLIGVEERRQEENYENLRVYKKLINDLLDVAETGTLSWRQNHFVCEFLIFMIRWDAPLNPRLARYITVGLIDDALTFRQMATSGMVSILKKQGRKRKRIMLSPEEIISFSKIAVMPKMEEFLFFRGRLKSHYFALLLQWNPSISGVPVETGPIVCGDRHDNKWMQYDSTKVITTAAEYDSTIFIEKTHWGYYEWPKKLKTYALNDENYKLVRTRDELPDDEKEVFDHFSDPAFVKQLLKFHSLEDVKGEDCFDSDRVLLFKGLFRNFADSFLPVFRAELEELSKDSHESTQRCVSEVVTGIVMGSKHWNFEKVNFMWSWLIPVLQSTIDNLCAETLKDWGEAYGHIVKNRDPRKLHWLFEFLMKNPVSGKGGSFMDASRLFLIQQGIRQQEWRVAEILHRLLDLIEPKLDHQYKNVRDRMGSNLASIFFYDVDVLGRHDHLCPIREEFIERVFHRLDPLSKEGTPHITTKSSENDLKSSGAHSQDFSLFEMPEEVDMAGACAGASAMEVDAMLESEVSEDALLQLQHGLRKMISSEPLAGRDKEMIVKQFFQHQQQYLPPGVSEEMLRDMIVGRRSQKSKTTDMRDDVMESTSEDSSVTVDEERNSAVRLLKTLMKWIICGQRGCLQPTKACTLKLLPLICKMSPVDTQGSDEELHHDTQVSLSCLAQSYIPPDELKHVVDTIKQISESSSWHARHTILKFSQIFIFNNLFTLQEQQERINDIRDVILELITDEQLEVREMSTKTLGGLLQCGLMTIDEKLTKFIDENCKIRVKKLKKSKPDEKEIFQTKLRNRHAGVLALSSCILSSPYSIPEYLPDLLMKLSNHLHDPQPIESTVKKTFSEFRRTHHDSWHLDKLKFTSDQLSILTDLLVSPCYYA